VAALVALRWQVVWRGQLVVLSAPIPHDAVEAMLESRAKAVMAPATSLDARDPEGEGPAAPSHLSLPY
jgi:hypothetical protein